MDVGRYLERIGYTGGTEPRLDTLRALHLAHLFAVPFENLDIHARRPIVLDAAALFHKVVNDRRGGFCYELNGLFAALLLELGFDAALLSGRVHGASGFGPEYDHMAVLVRLGGGRWLGDVGFGESFHQPLPLDQAGVDRAEGRVYRARATGGEGGVWQVESAGDDGVFAAEYAFTTAPQPLWAFEAMCRFHQSSPESPFTRKLVCSRPTAGGRITLSGSTLITTTGGERQERLVSDLAATLRDPLGLPNPPPLLRP